jgi:hypothetical protein
MGIEDAFQIYLSAFKGTLDADLVPLLRLAFFSGATHAIGIVLRLDLERQAPLLKLGEEIETYRQIANQDPRKG